MEFSESQEKSEGGGQQGCAPLVQAHPPLPQPSFLLGFGKHHLTGGLLCSWKQCKFILALQRGPVPLLCGKRARECGPATVVPVTLPSTSLAPLQLRVEPREGNEIRARLQTDQRLISLLPMLTSKKKSNGGHELQSVLSPFPLQPRHIPTCVFGFL